MGRVAICFALILGSAAAAQEEYGSSSYDHLSDGGRDLSGDSRGTYNSRPESERTTFEAIVHALESLELLHLVQSVDAMWGIQDTEEGRHQFRLSATLIDGAVDALKRRRDFRFSAVTGHVKLADGTLIGGGTPWAFLRAAPRVDTVRQWRPPRGPHRASMQISWLEDDLRTADIDIDYRAFASGDHSRRWNSDVRFSTHYEIHVETYGPGLRDWWRRP